MGLDTKLIKKLIKQYRACLLRGDLDGAKKVANTIFKKCEQQVDAWIKYFVYWYRIEEILKTKEDKDLIEIVEMVDIKNEIWVEVFTQFKKKGESGKQIENFLGWLHNTVRNIVKEKSDEIWIIRRRQNTSSETDEQQKEYTLSGTYPSNIQKMPDQILEEKERSLHFEEALDSLSGKERDVIEKHDIQGIPIEDLARGKNLTKGAMYARRRKAIKNIKKYFQRKGEF